MNQTERYWHLKGNATERLCEYDGLRSNERRNLHRGAARKKSSPFVMQKDKTATVWSWRMNNSRKISGDIIKGGLNKDPEERPVLHNLDEIHLRLNVFRFTCIQRSRTVN